MKETDSKGEAKFTNLSLSLNGAEKGYINVHVSANGYGDNDSLRVTVVG